MAIQDAANKSTVVQLLAAAEQLTNADLGRFVHELLALRAKREAPVLPNTEAALIRKINRSLPEDVQRRYEELIEKRLDETMSDAEHEEFMAINQQVEALNVERITHLIALANIRQLTLPDVMQQLGISQPVYVS